MQPLLQFTTFSSAVEAPFWHTLADRKLNILKLNDATQPIKAYYATGHTLDDGLALPARLCIGTNAFDLPEDQAAGIPPFAFPITGSLKNTNTIEDFKRLDKTAFFKEEAKKIWHAIISGDAVMHPHLLSHFLVVTYADLKKYKFHYWFGFPALLMDPSWVVGDSGVIKGIEEAWSPEQIESLRINYDAHREKHLRDGNAAYFLVKKVASSNGISVGRLSEWDAFFDGVAEDDRILAFADPSSLPSNPGWPLRNLLVLAHRRWNVRRITVLCFREIQGKKDIRQSRVLVVEMPVLGVDEVVRTGVECPKVVGWEKGVKGNLAPRMADLAPLMDPAKLADTAVDLNLKLMRWRLVPSLQLEKIKETKCLLLGAGTLGCYVARVLLGWGVRNITFVDNATVSFSNPVRQPLFFFEDSLDGGKPKAQTAASNLKRVYPGVHAQGFNLAIPMPGHPITSEEQTRADVDKLTELIREHDVIYLLMDSRESRWLPTFLGSKMRKLVINAALGFDTYLVMRHGVPDKPGVQATVASTDSKTAPVHLGCYFCNDVVAPTDSLTDRTLDQQCTVTRPGLSAVASALAVELMVSVLHHEHGPQAPADATVNPTAPDASAQLASPLGQIPHQIRGFLGTFSNMLIVGQAYDRCTACSSQVCWGFRSCIEGGSVQQAYVKDGFDFLRRAFDDPIYLEEVSGLTKLKQESDALLGEVDWIAEEDSDAEI
ncbi:hypothetical protein BC936DRAFT_145578 [Jimgerdemannia flammicorona]|uniref:Ubiquitin-like modifier-activating enzyme ATG7 n=1 Tax=Jimgerdemannia flammicorona TaxID=994334 RepID=A0A433D9M1_9FUNG|nr:hypothetical protein BC936DRAFT_145578 [Jimgerdemannia flammicorona]